MCTWSFLSTPPNTRMHILVHSHALTHTNYCFIDILYSRKNLSLLSKKVLTKLNSWRKIFTTPKVWDQKCSWIWKQTKSKRVAAGWPNRYKRQPTFNENKFLTNCSKVAFDEIFHWRKFSAMQLIKYFNPGLSNGPHDNSMLVGFLLLWQMQPYAVEKAGCMIKAPAIAFSLNSCPSATQTKNVQAWAPSLLKFNRKKRTSGLVIISCLQSSPAWIGLKDHRWTRTGHPARFTPPCCLSDNEKGVLDKEDGDCVAFVDTAEGKLDWKRASCQKPLPFICEKCKHLQLWFEDLFSDCVTLGAVQNHMSHFVRGGGGGDLQQNRASDSSSCERMRNACLHFVWTHAQY